MQINAMGHLAWQHVGPLPEYNTLNMNFLQTSVQVYITKHTKGHG